ncbi:hypothetical protein ACU8V3_19905 [Cobetia marina]
MTPLAHARWRKFETLSDMLEAAGGREQGVAHIVSDETLQAARSASSRQT